MILKEIKDYKVGIIGSGFIAQGLSNLIISKKEFQISKILTRGIIQEREKPYQKYLTNSLSEVIKGSDIVIECTGDVLYATEVISEVIKNKIPVITMNTEFHVTVGSYFVDKGFITEAEGDQPGCLAALNEEMIQMGFKPIVYGNIKGFLNNNPSKKDMEYWAKKSNLSLEMVTSFTDGTKVQMEQAFVANGLKATILKKGLTGSETDNIVTSGSLLAAKAKEIDEKICDYVLSLKGPAGVFITGTHEDNQHASLKYYKVGDGPYYTLIKPFHLPHLEIYKTILRTIHGGEVLLNNSPNPTISVGAIAKKDLSIGHKVNKGVGSFDLRGEAIKIKDYIHHVPIGLANNIVLKKDIKEGEIIMFEDVEIPESLALEIWKKIIDGIVK